MRTVRLRRLVVVLSVALAAVGPVRAAVCLIDRADLARLDGTDPKHQVPLTGGLVKLQECRGQLKGPKAAEAAPLWVWYLDPQDNRTKRVRLEPNQRLEQRFSGIPTGDVAPAGGLLSRLWAVANTSQPGQRSYSRFDPRDGFPLAGNLLPERVVNLPLVLFGWDPGLPVQLEQSGTGPVELRPVDGVLRLDLRGRAPGALVLRQGRLRAELELVTPADAQDVVAGLAAIDREDSPRTDVRWRRVLWLMESGYELDAIHEQTAP